MKDAQHISEKALIRQCQNGDRSAFAPLINGYRTHLFSYLYRLTLNRLTAEDLLQETLVKTWTAIHKCKTDGHFRAWLFRIAYHTAVDYKRKWQKIHFVDNYPELKEGHNPHIEVEKNERAALLKTALAELTEKQRHVFLLRQHSELPFREIATLMNESLNTVLSHMNYAVRKLKKYMKEYYDVRV